MDKIEFSLSAVAPQKLKAAAPKLAAFQKVANETLDFDEVQKHKANVHIGNERKIRTFTRSRYAIQDPITKDHPLHNPNATIKNYISQRAAEIEQTEPEVKTEMGGILSYSEMIDDLKDKISELKQSIAKRVVT